MTTKFPPRFTQRIQQMLPKSEWEDFFTSATKPLPKTIRVSAPPLKRGEIEGGFFAPTWHLSPVSSIDNAFFITRDDQETLPLGKTLPHFAGQIYVQTLSSMLPVLALSPQPGEKILDMAAAPGSKSTFLAERMKNEGVLVVNEPSSSRSKKLASNLDRMGVTSSVMLQYDGIKLNKIFSQEFDRVLLDAPCSSEGYGRKSSDFFQKMWSERKIFEAAKLQKRLILSAFEILRPGGILVYSTCTSTPEENEAVLQYLIDTYPNEVEMLPIDLGDIPARKGLNKFFDQKFDATIAQHVRRIWPHQRNKSWDSEIFFLAKIQKKSALSLPSPVKHHSVISTKILKKNRQAEIITRLCKNFGMDRSHFRHKVLIERNGAIFLTSKEAARFTTKNQSRRCGLRILDKHKNITSLFAIHFGPHATKNTVELNEDEKNRWLEGYDLFLPPPFGKGEERGGFSDGQEILVRFQGYCLGYGKIQQNGKQIKNKLDRNLVF